MENSQQNCEFIIDNTSLYVILKFAHLAVELDYYFGDFRVTFSKWAAKSSSFFILSNCPPRPSTEFVACINITILQIIPLML